MRWCWPITVGIDVVRRIVVGREEIFVGFVAALHPRYVSAVAPVAAQVRRACSGRRVRFIVFVDNATAEAGGQYARAHGDVLLRRLHVPPRFQHFLEHVTPGERGLFQKLFAPLAVPELARLLLLDLDVLVVRDLAELWNHFELFPGPAVFGIAPVSDPAYFRCPKYGFSIEKPGLN